MEAAVAPRAKAIIHPLVDVWLVGGLSLVMFLPLLVLDIPFSQERWTRELIVAAAILNSPHIMSSAWLLYRTPNVARQHPWAAVRVPILLGLWGLAAFLLTVLDVTQVPLKLLMFMNVIYLPWHFTQQAFGMIATYTGLRGTPLAANERTWIRGSMFGLLGWHAAFSVMTFEHLPADLGVYTETIMRAVSVVIPVSALAGLYGWQQFRSRTGTLPAPEALMAWLSIYVWYAALARSPAAIVLVQQSHALQYLAFPLRVEMNRVDPGASGRKMLRDGAAILAAGCVLFLVVPMLAPFEGATVLHPGVMAVLGGSAALLALMVVLQRGTVTTEALKASRALLVLIIAMQAGCFGYWFIVRMAHGPVLQLGGAAAVATMGSVVAAVINTHHYFSDGVLWKLRNPAVRAALFSHLGQPPPRPTAMANAALASPPG